MTTTLTVPARALLLAAGLTLGVSSASAALFALSPTVSSGTQNFNTVFGMDFNVNNNMAIFVTQLAVFDNSANGTLLTNNATQPVVIQLWNRDTGVALATANFGGGSSTGTLMGVGSGQFFVKDLATPLTLGPGNYYISEDFGGTEMFGNVGNPNYNVPTINDGGGLISFVGSGRASNGHGAMFGGGAATAPFTNSGFTDGGPANRYTGPSFAFVAVPEPSLPGLLTLAGGAALAFRRRRPQPLA